MLEKIQQKDLKKKDISSEINELYSQISRYENIIKSNQIPVIISFDGWAASGKGSLIAKLIKRLDPRFFKVVSNRKPNTQELRKPWLWRHWLNIPKKGEFLILDRSWYRDTVNAYMYGEINKETLKSRLKDINNFERQLSDDGYLLIKFFIHISSKEQKSRLSKLQKSDVTSWRVQKEDIFNHENYDKFLKLYDKMLLNTNTKSSSWHIIPGDDRQCAELTMMRTIVKSIKQFIDCQSNNEKFVQTSEFPVFDYVKPKFELVERPKLSDVDMGKTLDDEEYNKKLKSCQEKLFELQNLCYVKKIPVIIGYEGWDAGGKGGNIKRVAAALDPRGYEVEPIAAPEPSELARHYLWRFWKRLENDGHFTIFDRTWYGRVMVEPIEKLTPEKRAEMAYDEINEFEKVLCDWGAVVIKFWINIDKDEQYRRFKERENTPEKRWKITDEDWRNRGKWDEYEVAVNKMISKTSTVNAPWNIIEGNDKKYARIKALKIIIDSIEKKLSSLE